MPKRVTPLTASKVQSAKPGIHPDYGPTGGKPYKLRDGGGLFLLVNPDGAKLWRLDYRRPVSGKQNTIGLGTFPTVKLAEAREAREQARKLLSDNIDPIEQRRTDDANRATAAGNSFEAVAREWFGKQSAGWAATHADKVIRRLERDLFPWIGARPISEIEAPELLQHLERIEQRGAVETAHRALQTCGQVFRYAIRTGRALRDPAAALKGALTPWRPMPFAAATTPTEAAILLRKIDTTTSRLPTRTALLLAPLLFSRPGELVGMRWQELDLDAGQWRYYVTKTKRTHIAALSAQAMALLRDLQPLSGRGEYVFPGGRDPRTHMTGEAILQSARRAGVEKDESTIHGFRHMASTLLNEQGWNPDAVEAALTHKMPGVRGVYNQAKYLDERRTMMQAWADYLDGLRTNANVVPIKRRHAVK